MYNTPITQFSHQREFHLSIGAEDGSTLQVMQGDDLPGTPFEFVPVNSTFMRYTQTPNMLYGHIAIATDPSLHLSIDAPITPGTGAFAYLAKVALLDDVSQLSQFWSLDVQTGGVAFLGQIWQPPEFPPPIYGPMQPVGPPEIVRIIENQSLAGQFFMFGSVTLPPPLNP